MKIRMTLLAVVVVLGSLAAPASARASTDRTCTWGGTPDAPTGTFWITPGLTNLPAATPLDFKATGKLGGGAGCNGTVTFDGQVDPGSTCLLASFRGRVEGLQGVASFAGRGNVDVPSVLYDKDGHAVGVENAEVLTPANQPHFTDCSTPQGFTGGWPGTFASVIHVGGASSGSGSAATGPRICTWGGTPDAPTGTLTINPGITNTPSAGPLAFSATGVLGGDCSGTLTYTGQIDSGSSCLANTFGGAVDGLPGVARFVGVGAAVFAPSGLYDESGNLVGNEDAQLVTSDNAPHFLDCNAPQGFTGGTFDSVIVLFGGSS